MRKRADVKRTKVEARCLKDQREAAAAERMRLVAMQATDGDVDAASAGGGEDEECDDGGSDGGGGVDGDSDDSADEMEEINVT